MSRGTLKRMSRARDAVNAVRREIERERDTARHALRALKRGYRGGAYGATDTRWLPR